MPGRAADVAEIRVGHLARAVDDAAHDGDLDALQVPGLRADALRRRLEVEERPAAARAGDELGLGDAGAGALQDVVGEPQRAGRVRLGLDAHQVADPVAQEAPGEEARLEELREEAAARPARPSAAVLRIQSGARSRQCGQTAASRR